MRELGRNPSEADQEALKVVPLPHGTHARICHPSPLRCSVRHCQHEARLIAARDRIMWEWSGRLPKTAWCA